MQGGADRPLGVPGRDLKVSNLLMTDKGCVKIGEPLRFLLRMCLQLSLCSTSSRSAELASPLTLGPAPLLQRISVWHVRTGCRRSP